MTTTLQLGVVMDPIAKIHFHKDTTLALLLEAKARGWILHYFEQKHLFLKDGIPYGISQLLDVYDDERCWFRLATPKTIALAELNIILMRKDPPCDTAYFYTTYFLEQAERQGVLIANKAQALRDANEKIFAQDFPNCCPPTLVSASIEKLDDFLKEYQDIVCKPLNGMAGTSIFRIQSTDFNRNVILELLTQENTVPVMAQQFISAITEGDKRLIMINGDPSSHCLARIPAEHDWRGNLARGAHPHVQPLSESDEFIAAQVGPVLRERGLYFVGLDIIGNYLTEINVTSPTGLRELDAALNIKLSKTLFDHLENALRR